MALVQWRTFLAYLKADAVNDGSFGDFREEEHRKPRYFQGWRMGVTLCATTAGTVLIVNVVLTAVAYSKYPVAGGLVTLQTGSCRKDQRAKFMAYVATNV